MGAIGDTLNLLMTIKADGSQARSESKQTADDVIKNVEKASKGSGEKIQSFSSLVDAETKKIKAATSNALTGFAEELGLSAEATAALSTALPIAGTAIAALAGSAAAAGAGLFILANNASEYASKFKDLQEITGLSAATLGTLKYAGEQGGVGLDKIAGATEKFSKLVGEAVNGSKDARDKLLALGIDPQAAFGDLDGALQKAFATIQRMPEGMAQMTSAQNLFGRSGADLLPLIKAMDGDLAKATETAKKLGLILSQADIDAGDKFGDTLAVIKAQAESLTAQFALSFAPTITTVMGSLSTLLAENKGKAKEWGNDTNLVLLGIISYWKQAAAAADKYFASTTKNNAADYGLPDGSLKGAATSVLQTNFPLANAGIMTAKALYEALYAEGANVERQSQNIADQFAKVSAGIKGIPSLRTQMEIDQAKKDAETFSKVFNDLTSKIAFFGQESEVAATKQQLINAGFADLDSAQAKNLLSLAATIDKLKEAKKAQDDYNNEVKNWRKELESFTDKAFSSMFPQQSELDRFNKWVKTTKADMSDLKDEVRLTKDFLQQASELKALIDANNRFNNLDKSIGDITQSVEHSTIKFSSLEAKLLEVAKSLNLAETSFINLSKVTDERTSQSKNITDEVFVKKLNDYLEKYRKETARYQTEIQAIDEQRKAGDNSDSLALRDDVNASVRIRNLQLITDGLRQYLATLETLDKDGKATKLFGETYTIDAFIQRIVALDNAVGAASLKVGLEKLNSELDKLGLRIGDGGLKSDLEKLNIFLADPEVNKALEERARLLGLTVEQLKEYIRLKAENDADPRSTGTRPRVVDDGLSNEVDKTKKDSALVNIFGGLAGGGAEEKDSTGQFKTQADYMKGVYDDLAQSSNAAVGSMIGGLADLAKQWVLTGKFSVKAAAQMVAGILLSLAIEDGVKALHELAEGLAMAANPFTAALAPGHFAAAAAYGTAAAQAGGAGIAVGLLSRAGGSGQTNSSAVTSAASSSGSRSFASSSSSNDERTISESRRQSQEADRKLTIELISKVQSSDSHIISTVANNVGIRGELHDLILKTVDV